MKKIIITVGERRLTGRHSIESDYERTGTINVLKNFAQLLEEEHEALPFKKRKQYTVKMSTIKKAGKILAQIQKELTK